MALAGRSRRRGPSGSAAACRPLPSCAAGTRCRRRASSTEAEVVAPDALEDHRPRQHLPRVRRKSSSSENSVRVSSIGWSPRRTSRVPGSSSRSAKRRASPASSLGPPQERAHAREELLERERLRHVVVGARVEPGDAVLDLDARGQHEDGQRLPRAASRRQTSRPSTPGMRTSRIIASGSSLVLEPVRAPQPVRRRARSRSPRARARGAATRARPVRRRRPGSSWLHCCASDSENG